MTVSATGYQSGPYAPNGVTTTFAWAFFLASAAEILVVRRDDDGIETEITTGFTVTGTIPGQAGNVVFDVAPAAGDPIYILPAPAFTQSTDLINQGSYSPGSVERALDRAVARDIRQQEELDRTIKVRRGETPFVVETFQDLIDAAVDGISQEAVELVTEEGDTQVARVIGEGDTQVARVTAEGNAQVGLVTAEGLAQVAAVEAAGGDIYTTLAEAASARVFPDPTAALTALTDEYGFVQSTHAPVGRRVLEVSGALVDQGDTLPIGNVGLRGLVARATEASNTAVCPPGVTYELWAPDAVLNHDMQVVPNRRSQTPPSPNMITFGFGRLLFSSNDGTLTPNYSYEGGSAVVASQGAGGYTNLDEATVVGGTGTAAVFVLTVVAGNVTAVTPKAGSYGDYTVHPTNPVSVTGGSGAGLTLTLTKGPYSKWTTTAVNQRLQLLTITTPHPDTADYKPYFRVQALSGAFNLEHGQIGLDLKSSALTGPGTVDTITTQFAFVQGTALVFRAPTSGSVLQVRDLAMYAADEVAAANPGNADFNYHMRTGLGGRGAFTRAGEFGISHTSLVRGGVVLYPGYGQTRTALVSRTEVVVARLTTRPTANGILSSNLYDPSNPAGSTNVDRHQVRSNSTGQMQLIMDGNTPGGDGPDRTGLDASGLGWMVWVSELANGKRRLWEMTVPFQWDDVTSKAWGGINTWGDRFLENGNTSAPFVNSSGWSGDLFGVIRWNNKVFTDSERVAAVAYAIQTAGRYGIIVGGPDNGILQAGDSLKNWTTSAGGCFMERVRLSGLTSRPLNVRYVGGGGRNIEDDHTNFEALAELWIEEKKALQRRVIAIVDASPNNYSAMIQPGGGAAVLARIIEYADKVRAAGADYIIAITCPSRGDQAPTQQALYDAAADTVINPGMRAATGVGLTFDAILDLDLIAGGFPYVDAEHDPDNLHWDPATHQAVADAALPLIEAGLA